MSGRASLIWWIFCVRVGQSSSAVEPPKPAASSLASVVTSSLNRFVKACRANCASMSVDTAKAMTTLKRLTAMSLPRRLRWVCMPCLRRQHHTRRACPCDHISSIYHHGSRLCDCVTLGEALEHVADREADLPQCWKQAEMMVTLFTVREGSPS